MTLYIKDIHDTAISTDALLQQLPAWRREQALRFKHDLGRRQCAEAYLLLCQALREQYDITDPPSFTIGTHGKPSLTEHPDIHFNLSHCKYAVACAVSDFPVGVDVECLNRYNERLARHVLSDKEFTLVRQSTNPDTEFTRLWTMKESVCKLTGTGIIDEIKTLLTDNPDITTNTCIYHDKGYVVSTAEYKSTRQ